MSQNTKESINIHQTGRIGRLAKVIKKETNKEVLFSVIKDPNLYTSTFNNRKKAK